MKYTLAEWWDPLTASRAIKHDEVSIVAAELTLHPLPRPCLYRESPWWEGFAATLCPGIARPMTRKPHFNAEN